MSDKSIKIINIISHDDTNYHSFIMSNNKRMKVSKCPGCFPIFQENQEGHIGIYGCLEIYIDIDKYIK